MGGQIRLPATLHVGKKIILRQQKGAAFSDLVSTERFSVRNKRLKFFGARKQKGVSTKIYAPPCILTVNRRLLSAISGHSIRAGRRDWFSLESHTKNAIPKASPIQRLTCSAGVLFVQMHKAEAPTSPRHNVRSQADRSYSSELREQLI